jgi:hypothetical protein
MIGPKCIGGLIAGAIIGFIALFPVAFIIELIQPKDIAENINGILFLCFVMLGGIIGFILPIKEAAKEAAAAQAVVDAQEREKEHAKRTKNEVEHAQLNTLVGDLTALYETLNPLLDQAAIHVTHAESELTDDSVGAFWDEIEGATRRFAQYNNSISVILKLAKDHAKRRAALPTEFQPQPLDSRAIPDGDQLLSRMAKIVKQARRNPQWETIFQQRRTNDILVRGFENLGNALDSLQDTVTSGFNDLALALHSSVDQITSEHSDRVITELNQLAATHSEDSRERRRFEQSVKADADKAVQVLEKIENRRRYG